MKYIIASICLILTLAASAQDNTLTIGRINVPVVKTGCAYYNLSNKSEADSLNLTCLAYFDGQNQSIAHILINGTAESLNFVASGKYANSKYTVTITLMPIGDSPLVMDVITSCRTRGDLQVNDKAGHIKQTGIGSMASIHRTVK